jgi:hypothetical protein
LIYDVYGHQSTTIMKNRTIIGDFFATAGAGGVSGIGDTARMMAQFGARIHHPGLAAIANRPALLKSATLQNNDCGASATPLAAA